MSPAFYGGDLQEGVLVLEDLGDGDSVADVLLGSDASREAIIDPGALAVRFARALVFARLSLGDAAEDVQAGDDAVLAIEAVTATAYQLIETTTVALSAVPFHDFVWGTSTIGRRLALRSALFAELADETGSYRALAAVLTSVVDHLGLAGEQMPLYPAFGGPPIAPPPSSP